jgi:hypothetical protein
LAVKRLDAAQLPAANYYVIGHGFAHLHAETACAIQQNLVEYRAMELRSQPRAGLIIAEWNETPSGFRFHPVTAVPDETCSLYFTSNSETIQQREQSGMHSVIGVRRWRSWAHHDFHARACLGGDDCRGGTGRSSSYNYDIGFRRGLSPCATFPRPAS